ncbi:hypothetical protein F2P81_022110 [Scophthalmus maximus]|uniref:PKD domain-containing protein n=1 Tax=Scophthalmus maximus TaxID=52904 RepID=A0A6A4RY55_SCOMX|nr:hypothetical protein F2P81_022110 [Scophthalmus maximus]
MDRKNGIWILMLLLLVLLGVAETTDPLADLEKIAGKLVFYQMEGNATYVRDTGELASDIPTETMFELFDPQQNFSTAKFTYTWDLGNGEVIQGTEPVVRYHYPESGNYTLQLKVVNMTKYAPEITGVYSTDVKVLDVIKNIELKGPSDYAVSQDFSLDFHVDGRQPPPLLHAVMCCRSCGNLLLHRSYRLSQQITDTSPTDLPSLWINVILQTAASSNAVFLKNPDSDDQSTILFKFSNLGRGEKEPLMHFLKSDKPLMFQQMPTCTSSFPLPGPLLIKFRSEEPDGATQPPSVQIKGFNMQSILCHWKNGMFMNMPFKLDEFCPQTRRPEKHPGVSSPNESVDFTHEHSVKATTAKPLKLSHVKLVHLQSHSTHTFFAHLF